MDLPVADAIRLRLAAHGLSQPAASSPAELLCNVGALQGQDLRAVTDVVAMRSGTPRADIAAAFGIDGVVRSWPMRGTLFATTPHRLGQFLSLTAPRLGTEMARRRANLDLTETDIERAAAVARETLAAGPTPRDDVHRAWLAAGLETAGGRAYHLTVTLALRGEVVWGPMVDGDQHLVGISPEALGVPAAAAEPEATLDSLVAAYVVGHGPVGIDEAAWWMKLPKTPVRAAATRLLDERGTLARVTVDGRDQVVSARALDALGDLDPFEPDEVLLLPRFDEWTLGYQDRSLVASPAMVEAIDPKRNGQFRRLVTVGGRVVATWERDRSRTAVLGEIIEAVSSRQRDAIDEALAVTTLA